MNFDKLQKECQQQDSTGQVKIDSDALVKLVRRNQKTMETTIFWRDFREVGIALMLVPVWIWMGQSDDLPWTWYLVVPALLWIAGFLIVDRRAQQRKQPQPGDSLRESVEHSLAQITHQIRLLKTVFRWYLLPIALPLVVFQLHGGLLASGLVARLIFFVLICWGVYELNQWAVRKDLEPRRDELQNFLESLDRSDSEAE